MSLHFSIFDDILGQDFCNVKNINTNESSVAIKILKSYDSLDFSIIQDFYTSMSDSDQIFIEHPVYNSVDTYGVYSFMINMTNFVVFTDSEYNPKYTWVLGQVVSAVSAIIIDGKIIHGVNINEAESVSKSIPKFRQDLSEVKYISGPSEFSGFLISNGRPYHYIYDSLYWAYYYQKNISVEARNYKVYTNKPFISLSDEKVYTPHNSNYYFKLCGLTRNFIRVIARKSGDFSWENKDVMNFEKWIYDTNNELDDANPVIDSPSIFKLWIGVTGQKRSWLQQVEGYSSIINSISLFFDSLIVYIDGWTSPLNNKSNNEEDDFVFGEIKKLVESKNVTLVSLIGETYPAKIQACKGIDFHISVGGTGAFVPLRICRKPGVIHCNKSLNTFDFDTDELIDFIAGKDIIEIPVYLHGKIDKSSMNISYSASWQLMYNFIIDFIKNSRGVFLGYKEVRPVAEISSSHAENYLYLAENKLLLSELFKETNDLLRDDVSLADMLICLAKTYEECGDISAALRTIRLAKVFRPKGSRILNKEELYLKMLS